MDIDQLTQPTNSERLYTIFAALMGDSDPTNWNINGVTTLVSLVKQIGLRDTENEGVDEAAATALYQVNRLVEKLRVALTRLPEYVPRLRRSDEITTLKQNWIDSGRGWQLENTAGFEAHREDLRTFSLQTELGMLHAGESSSEPSYVLETQCDSMAA